MSEPKCHINERLHTGLAQSVRAAGMGISYDRYDDERREKAEAETLTAIFEHIDRDEYLRKEFCIHPGREDCPSEAANGYVDVDDCCGCPLFVNSYSGPQAEKGEADGK